MTTLREELLENGLRIVFVDESNRYFGDYHRIRLVANIHCDIKNMSATNENELHMKSRALDKFGDTLTITKSFERMGVATAEVDSVRSGMIDDFLQHTAPYLSRPEYPLLLVKAELARKPAPRFYA